MNTTNKTSVPSAPAASRRVLVPLKLAGGTTEALLHLQQMVLQVPSTITLLNVVEVNVVPPNESLYSDLCAEAEKVLRRLARYFFGREDAVNIHVRIGRACEQILCEARQTDSELILLSTPKRRGWRRWFRPGTTERVMRSAPCPILVVPDSSKIRRRAHADATETPAARAPRLRPTWVE